MALSERQLEFRISMAKGVTGEIDGETVTLTGYRARFSMQQYGGASQGQAQIAIYGLPMDLMNRLTNTVAAYSQIRVKNRVQVLASDRHGMSTVFDGVIFTSCGIMHDVPDFYLSIVAFSAADAQMNPISGTSFAGAVPVRDIMAAIANKAGMAFEDSGVTGALNTPAFSGDALSQIRSCADAAGINFSIEQGTLAIWPRDGHRKSFIPVLSPSNGLVGYPTFSSAFVELQSEFLPMAQLGGVVEVRDSVIAPANGRWIILQLHHELASEMPGGPWFSYISGAGHPAELD